MAVPEHIRKVPRPSNTIVVDAENSLCVIDDRWLLELVFKRYKSDECLDRTNVQGDFSLIGSEFVNFIATAVTCRMLRKAREAGLLEKLSFGDLMEDLSSAWRMVNADGVPATDDCYWVHTLRSVFDEMEALGISTPIPKPPARKRGRPRKKTSSLSV